MNSLPLIQLLKTLPYEFFSKKYSERTGHWIIIVCGGGEGTDAFYIMSQGHVLLWRVSVREDECTRGSLV